MIRLLLLPLLTAQALGQSTTVLEGTVTATVSTRGGIDGIPTEGVSYLNYGTTVIYNSDITSIGSVPTGSATLTESDNSTSPSTSNDAFSSALVGTVSRASANATETQSATSPSNITPCNGYPQFCNRQYSNITMVTAHNSPFTAVSSIASNQDYGVIAQLNDGIRMVQGQAHFVDGVPHMCHTSCDLLDAGTLESWLANVTEWLSQHPYDVVTVLIANGDYAPITNYISAFISSGIVNYAYIPLQIPMNISSWPTLGQMVSAGKRAVIFMDYDANQTVVPYVLDEFSQMWETPFDPTDANFPCTVSRPPNLPDAEAREKLYMINHNLNSNVSLLGLSALVPNLSNIATTNGLSGFSSLGLSANQCISNWLRPPNFLLVDYYNRGSPYNGSVFGVAAEFNNVSYNSSECCGQSLSLSSAGASITRHTGTLAVIVAAVVAFLTFL